jgi:hypothetical protein
MAMSYDTNPLMSLRPSRGRHSTATAGVCLMELVSVVAGEPFTDHPQCVHPALALAARVVNDQVGDTVRQSLVPLLPQMMSGPRRDLRAGPVIALSCLDTALAREDDRRLRLRERRLLGYLHRLDERGSLGRVTELRCRLAVFTAVRCAAARVRLHGQTSLAQMLTDATHTYCAIGRSAVGGAARPAAPQRAGSLVSAAG